MSEAEGIDEQTDAPRFGSAKRLITAWLLITTLFWGASASWLIYSAQADARAGEAAIRSVANLDDPAEVDLETTAAALASGKADLEEARESLASPLLAPLGPVPIVGRQLESAEAMVIVTDDLVAVLEPLLTSAQSFRDDPNGVDRVAFLRDVGTRLEDLDAVINEADLGPSTDLVPALADGRGELSQRLIDLRRQARSYAAIANGMAEFLDGSSYLLAGANNAEMRIGSGMFLSIGRFETLDGEFDLPGLTPSSEFAPITGAPIVDPDMARMWGFTSLSSDFRGLGYSARFDEHLGPQALELWEASTGEKLDGVLMVDPFVLDALLGVIGDVEVDGRAFRQGEALDYLVRGQYAVFNSDEVEERQDLLSILAAAVVEKLGSSSWDPIELLRQLEPVANSRHIMAYSIDPVQQAAWEAMGITGSLSGEQTAVFLLNHGGSKLDTVMEIDVDATTARVGSTTTVSYDILVTNNASAGLPEYVIGPWESLDLPRAGTYLGRVAVYAPGTATDLGFGYGVRSDAAGSDGPVEVVASEFIELGPGQTRRFRFGYTLPADDEAIDLLPSGRFPAVEWNWNGTDFNDAAPRVIDIN